MAEDAAAVLGVGSSSPLTSNVGVIRRTGFPIFCGTCRLRRCLCVPPALMIGDSPVEGGIADAGVGGNRNTGSFGGDFDCTLSTMGVNAPECFCTSTGVPSLLGLTGNVTKGPSRVERLLGGRPLGFPPGVVLLADQADDTAGPWRRLARGLALDGVTADWGSSKKWCAEDGVTADSGWGVAGSCEFRRQRICCPPDIGDAEYGVRLSCCLRRLCALRTDAGVIADAAVQGS